MSVESNKVLMREKAEEVYLYAVNPNTDEDEGAEYIYFAMERSYVMGRKKRAQWGLGWFTIGFVVNYLMLFVILQINRYFACAILMCE